MNIARTAIFLAAFPVAMVVHAQTVPSTSAGNSWASMQQIFQAENHSPSAADLIHDADTFGSYYRQHPNDPNAENAKCLEALALVKAWLAGDSSQTARRTALVAGVREDKAVSDPLRAQLFALSDSASIEKQAWNSRDAKLAAYAKASRALITEFPTLPNGYEALIAIARDSSDAAAPVLATQVAQMAGAPAWVRVEARTIEDRFALIGKSLPGIADPILAGNSPFHSVSGHSIVLYSWSSGNIASMLRAKATAAKAPGGAIIVGLCLDSGDLLTSKAEVLAQQLPGTQLYDPLGAKGELAKVLELTEPGLIYLADSGGVIRSVCLQNDLGAALTHLSR